MLMLRSSLVSLINEHTPYEPVYRRHRLKKDYIVLIRKEGGRPHRLRTQPGAEHGDADAAVKPGKFNHGGSPSIVKQTHINTLDVTGSNSRV